MRPTLLLAGLLAVLPFISATPSPAEPARRASPTFVDAVPLTGVITYKFQGCYSLGAQYFDETPAKLTVETCTSVCNAWAYDWAGVGNNKCLCNADSNIRGTLQSNATCQQLTCSGNSEYCGSSTSIVVYAFFD